jgi:CubicO group peptidase (beta-lactamase class C family)
VEEKTGVSFEKFMDSCFYKPLGLRSICYNPHNGFEVQDLIPTEYDTVFRNQLIRGDVHDPGAAMLGGVAGHAGLFANADDLAVLMQMLLQNGSYGGKQYLGEKTIREFTRSQYPLKGNRRGAGFDKPLLIPAPHGPSCESASPLSFGHSGFTGTYLWADPANNLIFVFLSNRIYPSAVNQQISEMNIRTRIHQAMYDALEKNQIK